MKRSTAGFGAGVAAGLIKLLIDQIAFTANISNVNTAGIILQIFYGGKEKLPLISWGIYIVITGFIGLLVSRIISKEAASNFLASGIITGVVLWAIMNVILYISEIAAPTWSVNVNSFIINLFSHIVFGIIVIYAISKSKEEVVE
jgi:hypothetical protein